MQIKELKIQKGHLYTLVSADRTVLIDRDIADQNGIKAGMVISDEDIDRLYAASQLHRAKSRCLWYLERRDHSAKELCDKLYGKFEPEYIRAAVERMEELGLVNDETYARRKAERMLSEQGMSLRMAKQKLMQKGIDRALIDETLADTEYDGTAAAKALIERKYAAKLGTEDDIRRTYQALLRRGFSHNDIRQALKEFKEELEFEE